MLPHYIIFPVNLEILFSCLHSSWTLNGTLHCLSRETEAWGSQELAKDEEQAGGSLDITRCQPSPTLLAVLLGTWCLEELTGGSVPSLHISEAMLKHLSWGQCCRGSFACSSLLHPLGTSSQ